MSLHRTATIDCGCLGWQEVNVEFRGDDLIGVYFIGLNTFNVIDDLDPNTKAEIEDLYRNNSSAKFIDPLYLAKAHAEDQ